MTEKVKKTLLTVIIIFVACFALSYVFRERQKTEIYHHAEDPKCRLVIRDDHYKITGSGEHYDFLKFIYGENLEGRWYFDNKSTLFDDCYIMDHFTVVKTSIGFIIKENEFKSSSQHFVKEGY